MSVFQKGLYELTIADLQSFFSTVQEETSVLEFKKGDATLETIHKEVVAFLNTEGGLLIIGAPKEEKHPERPHIKICSGSLTPSLIRDQDTLIRSIASNITPSPSTIKAKTIFIDNGAVFILEIGQSKNPPHQVSATGTYYIRLERDAKPAPHGIVEALFFRRQKSELKVTPVILVKPNARNIMLTFEFRNTSLIPVDRLGWQLNLHGVQLCKQINRNQNEVIRDDQTRIEDNIHQIVVKGMKLSVEFELLLRYPIVHFSFSYYSQDQAYEEIHVLYDTNKKDTLFSRDSKWPEFDIGDCQSVLAEYDNVLQKFMRSLLKINYTHDVIEPATAEDIGDFEYEFDIDFPRSLVNFWLMSNGFGGFIGEDYVIIFPVTALKNQNMNLGPNRQNMILQIGSIEGKPIFLHYKDGIPYFEWVAANGILKSNDTSSFFDLIDYLRSIRP